MNRHTEEFGLRMLGSHPVTASCPSPFWRAGYPLPPAPPACGRGSAMHMHPQGQQGRGTGARWILVTLQAHHG